MTDVDLLGKTLADLQSNISISATNAVTGDIEWCSGYTQFSTDIGEQAGWYLALQVTPDVEGATVTAAYNGTIRELDNNIFIIRLADGEDTITFTAEKEDYTTGRLTLDLSGLNKETITNYCYVTSLTNGVTVTPLQFGESKDLSGIVPYDTTTSSNKFRLSFRTFNLIPAGSEISVAHQGTPLGSGTFYVYTPQEGDGEPYSAAEIDITLTQAILDSESPTLSTTISPLDGAVTDRFYCSLNVDDVTLEAPDVSYLLDTKIVGSDIYMPNFLGITNEGADFYSGIAINPTINDFGTQEINITPAGAITNRRYYWMVNLPNNYNDGNYCPIRITYNNSIPATMRAEYAIGTQITPIPLVQGNNDFLVPIDGNGLTNFSIKVYDTRKSTDYIQLNIVHSKAYIADNPNAIIHLSAPTTGTYGNKTISEIQENIAFNKAGTTTLENPYPNNSLTSRYAPDWAYIGLANATTNIPISHYLTDWVYNGVNMPAGNYLIVRFSKEDINYPIAVLQQNNTWIYNDNPNEGYVDVILDLSQISNDFVYKTTARFGMSSSTNFSQGYNSLQIVMSRIVREPAPLPQMGVTINGFTYNNNTYSLTDILNNSSTAVLTATWEDNELVTNISGLNIKYNDIKGDGTFVHPIGITFENGIYNGKEIVRCFTAQGASGVIDGSGYNLPHTYIIEINNTNQNQFSLGFQDIENTSIYLYLNINNSTLETAP